MDVKVHATGKPKVLVVDDHPMMRNGLRNSLESFGVEVVGEADNGRSAVALVEKFAPQAVLMDLSMPAMDGVAATSIIRARHPKVAVVALTFHCDEDLHRRVLEAGASTVITKDSPAEEVVSALLDAIEGEPARVATTTTNATATATGCYGSELTLTQREVEVLALITRGASTNRIGTEMAISVKTVKNHLASIYEKLDVTDRTQAVLSALRMGLVSLD